MLIRLPSIAEFRNPAFLPDELPKSKPLQLIAYFFRMDLPSVCWNIFAPQNYIVARQIFEPVIYRS